MRRIFILLLAAMMVLACLCAGSYALSDRGPYSPNARCARQARAWRSELYPSLVEWTDIVTLADSTSRMSLSPLIRDMQITRRQILALETPSCAAVAVAHLDMSMEATIQAFTAFMAQKADSTVDVQAKRATEQMEAFERQLAALQRVPPSDVERLGAAIIDNLAVLLATPEMPRDTYINAYDPETRERLARVGIWGPDGTVVANLEHGDPIIVTRIDGPNCFVITEDGIEGILACAYTQLPEH